MDREALRKAIGKKCSLSQVPAFYEEITHKRLTYEGMKLADFLESENFEIDRKNQTVRAARASLVSTRKSGLTFATVDGSGSGGDRGDPSQQTFHNFYKPTTLEDAAWLAKHSVLIGEHTYDRNRTGMDAGLLGNIRRQDAEEEEKKEAPGKRLSFFAITKRHEMSTENKEDSSKESSWDKHIFLNVTRPICLVCVGVQGAGKSHTMNVVLENCMISCDDPVDRPLITLRQQMCGLVLHYDQSETNVCEAAGLNSVYKWYVGVKGVRKLVVLVSPTYYHQRKRFYEGWCEVRPLLFSWASLGAQQLKKLMRLSDKDGQLYVSVMLDLLRGYQRTEKVPCFKDFMELVKTKCGVKGQSGPLDQRLQLLQSIIFESDDNIPLRDFHRNMEGLLEGGVLVVADLTDPMLSADEANGIFQVLLEQFRKKPMQCGKVLACDEAHKYLGGAGAAGKEELSAAIVDTVRLMRHEGIRVLISTQSPMALPAELLELVSVTVLHSFQSLDWYKFISSKIAMPPTIFDRVKKLYPGQALLLSTKTDLAAPTDDECNNSNCIAVNIRRRLTKDQGRSRANRVEELDSRFADGV